MVKFAEKKEITTQEAVDILRDHVRSLPEPEDTGFKKFDAVRLDTGAIGVVESIDMEGCVAVCYLDEEGQIRGPAIGYELTKLEDHDDTRGS